MNVSGLEAFTIIGPGSEWFWSFVQAAGLLTTLVLIYRQLIIQSRNHIVMSLQAIRNTWDSPELLRARFRTAKNWLDGEEKLEGNALAVADFLEQLGSYYKLGAIPTNALWDTYSVHIEYYYCIFENQIKEYRTNRDDQTLYSDFEAAYNAMKRISAQKGAPSDGISDANRIAFLRDEMLFAKSEINILACPASRYQFLR